MKLKLDSGLCCEVRSEIRLEFQLEFQSGYITCTTTQKNHDHI